MVLLAIVFVRTMYSGGSRPGRCDEKDRISLLLPMCYVGTTIFIEIRAQVIDSNGGRDRD